jgi:putative hemolysin
MLLLLPAAVQAMANPSAVSCTTPGYSYLRSPDAAGNEAGTCTLADGQRVDAREFLPGQTARGSGFSCKERVPDPDRTP